MILNEAVGSTLRTAAFFLCIMQLTIGIQNKINQRDYPI